MAGQQPSIRHRLSKAHTYRDVGFHLSSNLVEDIILCEARVATSHLGLARNQIRRERFILFPTKLEIFKSGDLIMLVV